MSTTAHGDARDIAIEMLTQGQEQIAQAFGDNLKRVVDVISEHLAALDQQVADLREVVTRQQAIIERLTDGR